MLLPQDTYRICKPYGDTSVSSLQDYHDGICCCHRTHIGYAKPYGDTSVSSLQAKIRKMLQPFMTERDISSSPSMADGDIGSPSNWRSCQELHDWRLQ